MQGSGADGITAFKLCVKNFEKDFSLSWKVFVFVITKMIKL